MIKTLIKFLARIVVGYAVMVADAWLMVHYWGWFVVPTFGLPRIGLWIAFGLNLLCLTPMLAVSRNHAVHYGGQRDPGVAADLALWIGAAWLTLAVPVAYLTGYVVHLLAVHS